MNNNIHHTDPLHILTTIIHDGVFEAAQEIVWQDTMADFTDDDMSDVEITINFEVGEAGGYDYAVDSLGMEVGEGWIGEGYTQARVIQAIPERVGDQLMCHGCSTFVCYDTPACSI